MTGKKITLRENHRFSNDPVFVNGRFTWDILRIFFEIKNSITKTVIDGDDVSSMGIDTWGVDYGLLDRNGRLMANPTHYRDTRTVGISDYVSRFVSAEKSIRSRVFGRLTSTRSTSLPQRGAMTPICWHAPSRCCSFPTCSTIS